MSDASALCSLAGELAKSSGELLRKAGANRRQRRELVEEATRKSSLTDLATAADRASERLILERLHRLRPDDGVVAEESGEERGTSGLTWIVDPLDGTTNFVYAFPAWAVSVAVADGEGTLAGAVYDPVLGELFSAARGEGATLNGRPLGPLVAPALAEALVGTGFSYLSSARRAQARLLRTVLPKVRDIRRGGAASLDLCYVGAGRLDGYYESGLKPWDFAAGLLVACEAGASCLELGGLVSDEVTLCVASASLIEQLGALLEGRTRRGGDKNRLT